MCSCISIEIARLARRGVSIDYVLIIQNDDNTQVNDQFFRVMGCYSVEASKFKILVSQNIF